MRLYHTLLRADFELDARMGQITTSSGSEEARELARDLSTVLRFEGLVGKRALRYLMAYEPMLPIHE